MHGHYSGEDAALSVYGVFEWPDFTSLKVHPKVDLFDVFISLKLSPEPAASNLESESGSRHLHHCRTTTHRYSLSTTYSSEPRNFPNPRSFAVDRNMPERSQESKQVFELHSQLVMGLLISPIIANNLSYIVSADTTFHRLEVFASGSSFDYMSLSERTIEILLLLTSLKAGTPPSPRRPQTARPTCTHISMVRMYGDHVCHMCNQRPPLGWVYACRQDAGYGSQMPAAPSDSLEARVQASNKSDQRKELEAIGLSEWIIKGIEANWYTEAQIEILKQQKLHLKATIASVEAEGGRRKSLLAKLSGRSSTKAEDTEGPEEVQNKEVDVASNDSSLSKPKPRRKKAPLQPCKFQCCHKCRPTFGDRIYMSFESVFSGEVPPITAEELTTLRSLPPQSLLSIGLPKTSSSPTTIREIVEVSSQGSQHLDGSVSEETNVDEGIATTSQSQDSESSQDAGLAAYEDNSGYGHSLQDTTNGKESSAQSSEPYYN